MGKGYYYSKLKQLERKRSQLNEQIELVINLMNADNERIKINQEIIRSRNRKYPANKQYARTKGGYFLRTRKVCLKCNSYMSYSKNRKIHWMCLRCLEKRKKELKSGGLIE
jgi:hypothetical protein